MAKKQGNMAALLIVSGVIIFIAYIVLIIIIPNLLKPDTQIWLGDGIFQTKLAQDDNSRLKGLAGTTELSSNQGLLMVFPKDGRWSVTMKDVEIPVDVVWLNADKKVVYMVKNIPAKDTRIFKPIQDARYIVELPARTVDSKVISTNSTAIFDIDTKDVK